MVFRQYPAYLGAQRDYTAIRYEDPATYEPTPAGYVGALRECGLFLGLPDESFALNVASVAEYFGDKHHHPRLYGSVNGDAEWVYTEGDHLRHLLDFSAHAYGLLPLTGSREKWEREGQGTRITLSTTLSSQEFTHSWPYEGDYASMEFYKFLDALILAVNPGLCVKLYRQTFVVCDLEGFKRCVRRRLIPVQRYEEGLDQLEI